MSEEFDLNDIENVRYRINFKKASVTGASIGSIYVVLSYSTPIFVYKSGVWYEVAPDKKTKTTSAAIKKLRPNSECVLVSDLSEIV